MKRFVESISLVDLTSKEFGELNIPKVAPIYFVNVEFFLEGELYWMMHSKIDMALSTNIEYELTYIDKIREMTLEYFKNNIRSETEFFPRRAPKQIHFGTHKYNLDIVKDAVKNFYEPNFNDIKIWAFIGYFPKKDINNLNLPNKKIRMSSSDYPKGLTTYQMIRFRLDDWGILGYRNRYKADIITPSVKTHKKHSDSRFLYNR